MTVRSSDGFSAAVEGRGERRTVSLLLVGPQAPGTALLVHGENALRVLAPDERALLEQALDGLDAALAGQGVDAWFPDLAGREPQLPPHLRRADGGEGAP